MQHLKRPGTWLGLIALVFAMSGSAYAAAKITGAQIKDGTITGKDIKNDTLTVSDISASLYNQLSGTQGPQGPAGAAGPAGPAGPSAVSKLTPATQTFYAAPGATPIFTVTCPAGQRVISGGYTMIGGASYPYADKTYDGTSWSVGVDNFNGLTTAKVDLTALCSVANVAVASGAGHSARDAKIARDEKDFRANGHQRRG